MMSFANQPKSQKSRNRVRERSITGGMDAKACLQPNFDADPIVNDKADYHMNLRNNTGVKMVDLSKLPAFKLNDT